MPLSNMSDGLFVASTHSNARFHQDWLNLIIVVDNVLYYILCCFNLMLSIGCKPNV
jgi:hypothetical protein